MNSTPQDRFDEWWAEERPNSTPVWELETNGDTKEEELEWDDNQT